MMKFCLKSNSRHLSVQQTNERIKQTTEITRRYSFLSENRGENIEIKTLDCYLVLPVSVDDVRATLLVLF